MTDLDSVEPNHYAVSVRKLCEFGAKQGDLDLRFTPSPSAQQGREGHQLVSSRRPPPYQAEVKLTGSWQNLRIGGRADGYDPQGNVLEEVKTFRGSVQSIASNHTALHWAQLKVYGWLMCQTRSLERIHLSLVYFDVVAETEHPFGEEFSALTLQEFFESLCQRFLGWAQSELLHRAQRDAALQVAEFPQLPFRAGQRQMAAAVYRACTQSKPLLVQAPTGIGKTMGTLFPALRAMPQRAIDKIFFLTAKTPGRRIALDALQRVDACLGPSTGGRPGAVLRVLELVARDKCCEHPDKSCHGQSCPLASGFYDRLPSARVQAAQRGWLDQASLRHVALSHSVCPYYLGHEMVRWVDVVVGDYNYYFDRSAMLFAQTSQQDWRVSVLVDEAHNLYARACAMYSAELSEAQTSAVADQVPAALWGRAIDLRHHWQAVLRAARSDSAATRWRLLDEVPQEWLRALQRFNSAASDYLNDHPAEHAGGWLLYFFQTLAFAALAEEFGAHSLCELRCDDASSAYLALRNVVPGHFIGPRMAGADSLVLFSATLNPTDYYSNLLAMPPATGRLDVESPFAPEQLAVRVAPISTRRNDRLGTLDSLVDVIADQFAQRPGNYLAFFSSFDYMNLAAERLQMRHPTLPVWSQLRQMDESARFLFLQQFRLDGQGIGFAVLGGAFGEGVDLPGTRLIGAFIATLGLPQFDELNQAICQRMQAQYGRGYDYTYVFPGLQKVVQAAGRVIRASTDTGTLILLDDRYQDPRYRMHLPASWRL